MLQVHEAALTSANVPYHEFLLFYTRNAHIVYGFVEGKEDPSLYRGMIDSCLPEGWKVKLIRSGNKKKVFLAYDLIDSSRFPKTQVCFYVDRDLSEYIPSEMRSADNIYISDMYSIENSVVTVSQLETLLEDLLGITNLTPKETEAVKQVFEQNLAYFQEAMAPVMAQILLWQRGGKRVSLNNIELKELFTFASGRVSLKPKYVQSYERVLYAANCVQAGPSDNASLAAAESEFRSKDGPQRFTRGKYLLWFFVHCAKELHAAIAEFSQVYRTPPKVRVELGTANAMAVIGPRVRCPASLKAFINKTYSVFIDRAVLAT